MSLGTGGYRIGGAGFPRSRGDEPRHGRASRGGAVFSPLTRG